MDLKLNIIKYYKSKYHIGISTIVNYFTHTHTFTTFFNNTHQTFTISSTVKVYTNIFPH